MFYLVGLGLGDAEDITAKGLDIVRRAERVYLESYTSILTVGVEKLVSSFQSELFNSVDGHYDVFIIWT
jgi:diphthine methyl ester synthase